MNSEDVMIEACIDMHVEYFDMSRCQAIREVARTPCITDMYAKLLCYVNVINNQRHLLECGFIKDDMVH